MLQAPARAGVVNVRRRALAALVAIGALAASVALALCVPSRARAQREAIEPEVRVDGIIAHASALQAALGADIPISPAMHLELAAGVGPSFEAGAGATSARAPTRSCTS